jgi:hypothetical protein
MMRPNTGLHADHAWRHIGKPGFDLAAQPLLALRRADPGRSHGRSSCRTTEIELLGRGVLSLARLQPQSLAGQEDGRTIPLADLTLGITQARQILANVNQITLDTPLQE